MYVGVRRNVMYGCCRRESPKKGFIVHVGGWRIRLSSSLPVVCSKYVRCTVGHEKFIPAKLYIREPNADRSLIGGPVGDHWCPRINATLFGVWTIYYRYLDFFFFLKSYRSIKDCVKKSNNDPSPATFFIFFEYCIIYTLIPRDPMILDNSETICASSS